MSQNELLQDVVSNLRSLADSVQKLAEAIETGKPTEISQPETPGPNKATSGKGVSLEQVRAKLAALSQAGKQAEVKALITEFGAKKLSDVPQDKYPELLAKAEDIR